MSDSKPDIAPTVRKTTAVSSLPERRPQATWDEIGESFETMGKIGLALAVGLSAAGLFCRLAEQGKVKIPTLSTLLLSRGEQDRRSASRSQRASSAQAKTST